MGVQFELQKAVYQALATAMAPTPVYDHVPDQTAAPYVVVGEMTDDQWDTDTFYGRETELYVHSWSRYDGAKEVKNLMDSIKGALHDQTLTVAGATVVLCHMEFSEVVLDPDGITRHGVQRFRFLLTED